jgi:hypothetical protein
MFLIKSRVAAALLAAGAAFGVTTLAAQDKGVAGLTAAEFEKLHKELQPPRDELWRSIPWQVSIVEGRELAAREKKPIFVWVASGEPLGCG